MAKKHLLITATAGLLLLAGCSSQPVETAAPAEPPETTSDSDQATGPSAQPTESRSATPSAPSGKVLYLTFDDGPTVPYTDQLLKILTKNDATATFFVNGNMANVHKKQIKNIVAAGQAIGNHTYNHPHLPTLSDAQVKDQLTSTSKIVGSEMGPCMRPPYLDTDGRVRSISKKLGYATIMGDLNAQDWTTPPVSALVASLRKSTTDKNVIVLHDGPANRDNTVEAVRQMMPVWAKKGYSLEALPKCVESDATSVG